MGVWVMNDDKRMKGYVKEYRSALDNPLFNEKPFDRWHAFEYCQLKANHKPTELIYGNQTITVDRGQLFTSISSLASVFGWSAKKVRAWLNLLEKLEMLKVKGTTKGTIITVEKYSYFQGEGQADDIAEESPQGKRRTCTGNTNKNDKEYKEDIYSAVPAELKEAFMEYATMRKKKNKPIATKQTVIRALSKLDKLGRTTEEKIAILNQSTDNCWQGLFELREPLQEKKTYKF